MIPNETVKNVTYNGNNRTVTVERIISRSEDYEHISTLYYRIADAYRMIDSKDIIISDKEMAHRNLAEAKEELKEYLEYIKQYEDKEGD